MNIITISREFGSGGRELGKRLADLLGYDYYDYEIISAVAKNSGMDPHFVENTLSNHGWQNQTLTFRGPLGSSTYIQSTKINLLLEQKKVIEEIAKLGNNCIIVGRNADIILKDYDPLNIFVCAKTASKVKRCMQRASEDEKMTEKQLIRKIKNIDKIRSQTREIMSDSPWGKPKSYHLTVNTTDREIKDLVYCVAAFAQCFFKEQR